MSPPDTPRVSPNADREKREPYTIWSTVTTFRKTGFPVMGTLGSYSGNVVVMALETFKRLVAEHPSLATAEFRVGTEE